VTSHQLSGFAINRTSGALQEVDGSPLSVPSPYAVAIEPSGRYAFVGIDNPQVAVYSLGRPSGTLTPLDDSPFPFGSVEPKIAFATLP
jgi:hypothetical protein